MDKSYLVTGLVLGTNYEFVVEARNSVGLSAYSDNILVLFATAPNIPDTPTTANQGKTVVISWVAPYDAGSEITSYTIQIRKSDLTF